MLETRGPPLPTPAFRQMVQTCQVSRPRSEPGPGAAGSLPLQPLCPVQLSVSTTAQALPRPSGRRGESLL